MKRRDFIKLIGTASGATIVTSCGLKKKTDKLIPYLVPPEDGVVPGQSIHHSSTCTECPANCGLLVDVREKLTGSAYKRYPIKLEGVAQHPINDGALCVRGQSSLTRLYHPDRIKQPLLRDSKGNIGKASWEETTRAILEALENANEKKLRNYYLSSRVTGSLRGLIDNFCGDFNVERLPDYELFSYSAIRRAHNVLFSKDFIPQYRIDESDFLLTVGADILETHISPVSNSLMFASATMKDGFGWTHVEPHFSLTGMRADIRLTLNSGAETYLLAYILRSIVDSGSSKNRLPEEITKRIPKLSMVDVSSKTGIPAHKIEKLRDSFSGAARPLVIVGGVSTGHSLGLEAAVLGGLIQWVTGATGSLLDFSNRENYDSVGSLSDMEAFSNSLQRRSAGVVFISKVSDLSNHPALADRLKKVTLLVGMSDQYQGFMKECDVVLPLSHPLESWGDAEPRRGLRTVIQPVLEPLHDTLSEGDILLRFFKDSNKPLEHATYQEYLFLRWREKLGEKAIEGLIERGYHEEVVGKVNPNLKTGSVVSFLKNLTMDIELQRPVLILSPSVRKFDGRGSDLPLLSEIPDPVSAVSYGKWVSVSEADSKSHGLKDGDEVEVVASNFKLHLPVKVVRGLPEGILNVQIDAAEGVPYQADPGPEELLLYYPQVKISKTNKTLVLPILSGPISFDEREIIPQGHSEKHGGEEHEATLFPEHEHNDYRWAMAIDLDRCTGCSACVAACYIENNIPVVGPDEHIKGREMSWIRIEQHEREYDDRPQFMPMLCQHCDSAPCETVCPVFAAYHTEEGLNAQIYNRCVGTRYCSNNCPYKVRRFNWFDHEWPEPMDKMLNPDISVRTKGIMEKCTFCVQRIRSARDTAKDESRKIRDGEVIPACAQTCPTRAIVFGSVMDGESRVHKMAEQSDAYRALESLGTKPSVYYITKKSRKAKD
jgi:Fe-S-cluster-containing dehydrogenase component/anaerobic selenocysteine-containing dehydrogenase